MQPDAVGRVAIVGAGAVGGYYGGRLSEAGEEVSFLVRSGLATWRRDGLQVESPAGSFHIREPRVFEAAGEIGPVDLVVVAWKATSNEYYEEVIAPLLHEKTTILTLQNGLGNTEQLAALFGAERILGGLCFVCINRVRTACIRHLAKGLVTIGEHDSGLEGNARLKETVSLFQRAEIECRAVEDLVHAQWVKLVWNVPFNGLCIARGGINTKELLGQPGGEEDVRVLMGEVSSAAAALGKQVDSGVIEQQVGATREMGAYRPSSMIDYLEGCAVEVEAIWAEPLRRAEAAGARLPHWKQLLADIRMRLAERS